jgi:hypothetical protein
MSLAGCAVMQPRLIPPHHCLASPMNAALLLPPHLTPPPLLPWHQVVLMDSLKKRTTFLARAVAHLGEGGEGGRGGGSKCSPPGHQKQTAKKAGEPERLTRVHGRVATESQGWQAWAADQQHVMDTSSMKMLANTASKVCLTHLQPYECSLLTSLYGSCSCGWRLSTPAPGQHLLPLLCHAGVTNVTVVWGRAETLARKPALREVRHSGGEWPRRTMFAGGV